MACNPFTPVFGIDPVCMAGRDDLLANMSAAFSADALDPNLSTVIIGARGSGKTALLNRIARLAGQRGWVAVQTSSVEGMLEDIYQRTVCASEHLIDTPSRAQVTGVQIGQVVGVEWQTRPPSLNWRSRMEDLLDPLGEQGVGLLITVDEVNPRLDEMTLLSVAYQHFLADGYKVALVMAGLPHNMYALLDGKSTSFMRRARRHQLDRISDEAVRLAAVRTVESQGGQVSASALERIVQASAGFPYMLQLVGYWSWQSAQKGQIGGAPSGGGSVPGGREGSDGYPSSNGGATISLKHVEEGVAVAVRDMRASILEDTYRNLSGQDVRFLQAMALDEDESRMGDIVARLGVSNAYASQYRLRLIEQGVIGARGRGRIGFEIPQFREYVLEQASLDDLPDSLGPQQCSEGDWRHACEAVRQMRRGICGFEGGD